MARYTWNRIDKTAVRSRLACKPSNAALPCINQAVRNSGIGGIRLAHTMNEKISLTPDFLMITLPTLQATALSTISMTPSTAWLPSWVEMIPARPIKASTAPSICAPRIFSLNSKKPQPMVKNTLS